MSETPPAQRVPGSGPGEEPRADSPFDLHIGTEWGLMEPEHATATLEVGDHHKQPWGPVHGGVMCTIAESVVSRATGFAIAEEGLIGLGQSNHTNFLRPVFEGTIHVDAVRRAAGRTTWTWDVEITDDEGRLCAISRITVAVRPLRGLDKPQDQEDR